MSNTRKLIGLYLFLFLLGITALLGCRYVYKNASYEKISQVENYLKRVSPTVSNNLASWSKRINWPTWACGPTSWWMAKTLQSKFFPELPVVIERKGNKDCIVFRVGSMKTKWMDFPIDHCWVEVYYQGNLLWIDPTFGQFDNNGQALFAWFVDSNDKAEIEKFMKTLCVSYDLPAHIKAGQDVARKYVETDNPIIDWKWHRTWLDGVVLPYDLVSWKK